MPKMVIDRVDDIEVDNNMPDDFTFTKTAGRDIGYDRELMLGVPDPGSPAWLYDTDETRNNHPQFSMEHIKDPVEGVGLYHGENFRRDDCPSIGKVTDHRNVDGSSHAPSEQHRQAVYYLMDSFGITVDDNSLI